MPAVQPSSYYPSKAREKPGWRSPPACPAANHIQAYPSPEAPEQSRAAHGHPGDSTAYLAFSSSARLASSARLILRQGVEGEAVTETSHSPTS